MIKIWIATILISCTITNEDGTQKGKTRIEIVKSLPYRSMNIPTELKQELDSISIILWNEMKRISPGDFKLVKFTSFDNYSLEELETDDLVSARDLSYDQWKNRDFIFTCLAYKSYVSDRESGENKDINVIEIEHEDLTGTYYVFLPTKKKITVEDLNSNYVDRN